MMSLKRKVQKTISRTNIPEQGRFYLKSDVEKNGDAKKMMMTKNGDDK